MNDLGMNEGLYVVTSANLETSFIAAAPILVTAVETTEQLKNVAVWLAQNAPPEHPLTLVSAAGPTVQLLRELETIDPGWLPLQIYVPPRESAQVTALQHLIDVVAQLRNPEGGCPWDLAQTPETLIPYIIEEAYETVDAIRQGDSTAISDELGDLLLQVVLQSQIASETQQFSLTEVAEGITAKLIRRHPHVFGDVKVESVEDVHANWEAIKAAEKGEGESAQILSRKLERYARRLPPLMAGLKLSEKSAAVGFEWPDMNGVWAKFYEELSEFQEALLKGDFTEQQAELGDLLFTLVNIARWSQIDPTAALHQTNLKLIDRIRIIESKTDKPLSDHTPEEIEQLWQEAKRMLKAQSEPVQPDPEPADLEPEPLAPTNLSLQP